MIIGGLAYPNDRVEIRPVSGGLEVESQDLLDDIGTGTPVSSPADTVDVRVVFEGDDVSWRAAELHELANAPTIAPVAVADLPPVGLDAYYAASSTTRDSRLNLSSTNRSDDEDVEKVDLTLSSIGTQEKLVRALETNPYNLDHEFGNDLEAEVVLPADAQKVRWYHPEDEHWERAESVDSRETAFGDVDVFDITDASWYDPPPFDEGVSPALLYELEKDLDAQADVRCWDTRGYDTLESDDGRRQWQHVFSADHEYAGAIVLDSGRVRLRLDEQAGSLEAEHWESGEWADAGLEQPDGAEVYDIDITLVAMARLEAQLTIDVDGELFAIDLSLQAGHEDALVTLPDGQDGPIPDDVEDWLSPVAAETLVDVNASKGFVSRSDVSR